MSDILEGQGPAAQDNPAPATTEMEKGGGSSLLTAGIEKAASPEQGDAPAPVDNAAQADQGSAKPRPVELPGFAAAATKDLKGDQAFQTLASKFKSFDEMAKAHLELEKRLGSEVRVPGTDASEEELAAYRKAIGVPESPDKYVFDDLPELPPGYSYDDASLNDYKAMAHKMNLTPEQAQGLARWQNEKLAAGMKQAEEAKAIAAADARRAKESLVTSLRRELGSGFDSELDHAVRFVSKYDALIPGLKADLDRTGFGDSPSGIRLMMQLAKLTADDDIVDGAPASSGAESVASVLFGRSMS